MKYARTNWGLLVLFVMCAVVYRPWNAPHLPLTDFGIFLEARGTSHNLLSQYAGVASYYISEGRLCLITFLYMVLGSAAFGTWAPGWHWVYFALNSIVLVLAWRFFAATGINRLTAFLVLALWSMMGPTAELWVRPAGEPIALIFFFIALGSALNYATAEDWRRRAIVIAACAAGIILSKEMLVVLLPAGWVFSRLELRDGAWSWAPWTHRDNYLLGIVGAVTVALMVPVAYVAKHAHSASYAGQYALSAVSWKSVLDRLEIAMVPAGPRLHWLGGITSDPAWTLVRVLPNLMWIAMIVVSAAALKKGRKGWPLAFGLLWVTSGVLAYAPWPGQGLFYMMPFAAGTMFVAAHALNQPLLRGSKNRRPVFLIGAALILVASLEARTTINQHRLRANLNAGVIDAIARRGSPGVLLAAVPEPVQGTGGWANHLRGFAGAAKSIHVMEWRDLTCAEGRKAVESVPGVVVVSAAGGCNAIEQRSTIVTDSTWRIVWPYVWRPVKSKGQMYVAYGMPGLRMRQVSAMSAHDR